MNIQPFYNDQLTAVYSGDSLNVLRHLPCNSVDAVITDPPYSSGGAMRSDRSQKTSDKYTLTGTERKHPEFFGDNRDQRSFLAWSHMWLSECFRATKDGGVLLCFTDWRQLPIMTDAIQSAGWVWRGIVPWDKTEGTRPQRGWFRSQCEYILTASRGSLGKEQEREVGICAPGIFREHVHAKTKQHITAKPVPLMRQLMKILPQEALVLDPFAGSGSTAVAAKELGLKSILVEMSLEYCEIIKRRLNEHLL